MKKPWSGIRLKVVMVKELDYVVFNASNLSNGVVIIYHKMLVLYKQKYFSILNVYLCCLFENFVSKMVLVLDGNSGHVAHA